MGPSPGLALCGVVVIWDLAGIQERDIELEILPAKKTVAALGAFLGRVRSISPMLCDRFWGHCGKLAAGCCCHIQKNRLKISYFL